MQEFLERLKKAREHRGLSRAKLAEKLGKTGTTITRWENGDSPMSKNAMKQFCEVLEIHVDWLTDGVEPMESPNEWVEDSVTRKYDLLCQRLERKTPAVIRALSVLVDELPDAKEEESLGEKIKRELEGKE